ncbi:transposase [Oesophagostomum dentatum]|uniref:Transposase n=1 Tax=Oesophagostomum dentatum TaxID=61180 RepID=A0A0B1S7S9_OESDE|nr:transposase [Oesophagostomum dentatum]
MDIITGDEKWVTYVNVTRKRQWLQPGETGLETAKPELHPRMVMLSVWWNADGVIYWELLPNGSTVTADHYFRQLDEVASKVRGKQSNIYFLHDNARPHVLEGNVGTVRYFYWYVYMDTMAKR